MSFRNKIGFPETFLLIAISACAWVVLLFNPGGIMTMEHCHVSASGPSAASLRMLLVMNPPGAQLTGWALMVVAMMLPKLTGPIQDIRSQSLRRQRVPSALLFAIGYLAVWLAAGIVLLPVIIALNLWWPLSYGPALAVGGIAIVWQCTPAKQRCLNRGHLHRVLPAFGAPASVGALRYGLAHGTWCVGAGWALMLAPMLLPQGHNIAMLAATLLMLAEHLEHPELPRWRWRIPLRLKNKLVVQIKMRSADLDITSKVKYFLSKGYV